MGKISMHKALFQLSNTPLALISTRPPEILHKQCNITLHPNTNQPNNMQKIQEALVEHQMKLKNAYDKCHQPQKVSLY